MSLRRLLKWVTSKMSPPRVIFDRDEMFPYLRRWFIVGRPFMKDGSDPLTPSGALRGGASHPNYPFRIFIQQFVRSDSDQALHNHPWRWMISLILVGGYREERRAEDGDAVVDRIVKPFSINYLKANTFHRVDLLEEDAWSIFITGGKVQGWGFWDRVTKEYLPWRTFIERKQTALVLDYIFSGPRKAGEA